MATDWKEIDGDSKEKYGLYLNSREWSVLKRQVHERAGGFCERCNSHPIDAVHHLTYVRKYRERLEDLRGICNPCHEFTHGHSDDDPALSPDFVIGVRRGDAEPGEFRLTDEFDGKPGYVVKITVDGRGLFLDLSQLLCLRSWVSNVILQKMKAKCEGAAEKL